MRSISMKLLLAFSTVSLAGAVIFFTVARWNSNREIQDFLSNQDQTDILDRAASYYLENGSWEGFSQDWLNPSPFNPPGSFRPEPFSPFILVDINQRVVFGRGGRPDGYQPGDLIPKEELENALEISADDELIGWIVFPPIDWRESGPNHAIFQSMNRLLILSALGSAVVAVVLGIVLSRTLSRPLQQLSAAAQKAATGDLSQKVTVKSKDEIGALANSFNQMMADLERLIAARKQMTADIAHELRTPISVILGYTDGVHEGVLEPSLENFEIVRDEALRLERLVKDLKILSQADVGQLPLEIREFQVEQLVIETERATRNSLQEKNIAFNIKIEPDLPALQIDPDRILQAVRNILDNAIRHTPEGGQISFNLTAQEHLVQFSIQDSGPGIAPDELENVFRRFYRADSARTRDREGSGLGLAITRSVIEQHGGKIWAESPAGEGLKIIFELPVPTRN
ncbi:MAG: HAMP domain-containing protein [Anaerolineales bacterium]|nr:HAMP domain-containing protein [Anaerolineales bacterium]